jgi:hypothetical protein
MKRLITTASLIAVLVCASAALAHGSTVGVVGLQAPADATAGAPGDPCAATDPETGRVPVVSNAMAGSLIGCWYTDTFNPINSTASGVIYASGSEHFVGCLDVRRKGSCAQTDRTGTLALKYTFLALYDPATNQEVWGGCQHKIVSGTGGFAKAAGRIDFQDIVTNGTSSYVGFLTLQGRDQSARARAVAAAAAVTRPASMC